MGWLRKATSPTGDLAGTAQNAGAPAKVLTRRARLLGIACNVAATGLMVVLAVQIARWTLQAWRADANDAARHAIAREVAGPGPLAAWDDFHQLGAGAWQGVLGHQIVTASEAEMADRVVAACQQAAKTGATAEGGAGEAEHRLMARLARQQPYGNGPAGTKVFRLSGPAPMAVAVVPGRPAADPVEAEKTAHLPAGTPPGDPALAEGRVLSWSLAIPRESGEWTVWTYTPRKAPNGESGLLPFALPAGAERTLEVGSADGERLVGLAGPGDCAAWVGQIDQALVAAGWKRSGEWNEVAGVWHGRFEKDRAGRVDIQLSAGSNGTSRAIVSIMAPAAP